jgi:hypothetical protein
MYKTLLCFFSGLARRIRLIVVKTVTALNPPEAMGQDVAGSEINGVLVHAFSQGSVPAFRCIYDQYAPVIYRVSLRYLQSEPLASDLVQEVFAAFWHKRATFVKPEEVRLFLFTMARNVAVNSLGKMIKEMNKEPERLGE